MSQTSTTFIFDFDGTIADTHHYIIQISNRLANEFGYAKILPEEIDLLKDKTVLEVIKYLNVPVLKIPAIVARAKKEFQKDAQDLEPIKGLQDILTRLKSTGAQIGILSSNALENIHTFLTQHNLDIFDFVQSTTNIWGKHICLDKLIKNKHLNKTDVLYVGDEVRDITAAKKLGVRVAAVTWGYNSTRALEASEPDFLCATPEDLLNLIQETIAPNP